MSFYSIAPFIQTFYPEYYSIESYPANESIAIRKVKESWGILGNFAPTPIFIEHVTFKTSELLFQLMKFRDEEAVLALFHSNNPKMAAKHFEKTHRREDWGRMIVDAMKYCLTQKYEQSEEFRLTLQSSVGKFIVEDQTSFPKKTPDTWGTKLVKDEYVGPNLLGRLLMELRDNGKLEYHLPDDCFQFVGFLT